MKFIRPAIIALVAVGALVPSGASATASVTERVSVSSTDVEGNATSGVVGLSADGRFVAFTSIASNLVPGDTNGVRDVFVRDRHLGVTERVNVDVGGAEANAVSFGARMTDNGRYVTFWSAATNLVPDDTNAKDDVFIKDRATGTVERVSVSALGVQGNGSSTGGALSNDGRYVAFASFASNLVAGDSNGKQDVFVRDTQTEAIEQISVAGSDVNLPDISGNGNFVAFQGLPASGYPDVYLRDRQGGVTTAITTGGSWSALPRISDDGRFVTFTSRAPLAPPDATLQDVFIYDRINATFELASKNSSGVQSWDWSGDSTLSADGRYVTFTSLGTNMAPSDYTIGEDVYVRDRLAGTTSMVRNSIGGQGTPIPGIDPSADADYPTISDDGSLIVFATDSCNFVAGDTNGVADIFVWDVEGGGPPLPDMDSDGVTNGCDNCPTVANADQADANGNGTGNVCEGAPTYFVDNLSVDAEDDASPANSATSIGSTETCRNINDNDLLDADEDTVDSLTVDVVVGPVGIPPEAPLNALQFTFNFPAGDLQVTGNDVYQLLSSSPGSSIFSSSDSVPDVDGTLYVVAMDMGIGSDETGDGVLSRITVEAVNSGPALAAVTLTEEGLVDSSSALIPIGQVNHAYVAIYASCSDADGDSVPDLGDNCPNDANPDQDDNESDGLGDSCDPDDDNAGVYDVDEVACGGDQYVAAIRPERTDGPFAGVDDDGDTQLDEALPAGTENYDCDGDGFKGSAEDHVFEAEARANQDPCGTNGWPAELVAGSFSGNKINVSDLASFVVPVRYLNTDVGTYAGDVRWDLVPGSTVGKDINLSDMAALTVAASAYPGMLGGVRAFNGPVCPWAP